MDPHHFSGSSLSAWNWSTPFLEIKNSSFREVVGVNQSLTPISEESLEALDDGLICLESSNDFRVVGSVVHRTRRHIFWFWEGVYSAECQGGYESFKNCRMHCYSV
jgi:hypothetical protein